jgi:REP element-mobilizing transposase RayT
METKSEQAGIRTEKRTRPLTSELMKRYEDILKQIYDECYNGTMRYEDALNYIYMLIETITDGNEMSISLIYRQLPPLKFKKMKEIV